MPSNNPPTLKSHPVPIISQSNDNDTVAARSPKQYNDCRENQTQN